MAAALCAAAVFSYQPVAWTAAPGALGEISVKGSAEVNGVSSISGRTIFSGDRIVTGEHSTASVTSREGARLLVVESSEVRIKQASTLWTAMLDHGGVAAVSPGRSALVVEVRGMRIVPGHTGSVYAVQLEGSQLKVLAQSGAVIVEAANRTVAVPEGKTLDATVAPSQAGGAAPAGASSVLTEVLIVTTVALAGTAIALGVLEATKGCTVSPAGVGTCQVQ
jgi:hypothetical protein